MSQALIQPKPSTERGSERRADAWRAIAVCGFLVLAVLVVFSQSLRQGFLNWDDNIFVYGEPHVSGGLSWSGIVWAFTNGPLGEWYPLSMLSHMLDCQLYGQSPAGHHLTNLLLHAASAVTLFLVLWRMTAGLWPSALVAALFALHPLHVESVVWVAERRDVLSAFFFMLTLGAYGEYVRHPQSLGRYLAVVVFFALGLMAKSMLVTLPPLLLLLDFWPLGRFRRTPPNPAALSERQKTTTPSQRQKIAARNARPAPFPWRVVVDKLPLFALAIADAVATMLTHSGRPDPLTVPERLANAAVSCVAYLGQLFVPVGLSAFYSHPEAGWPARQIAAAVALLLVITAAAVIGRRAYPYFFVGWFWYLGMLVPALGLAYVGAHARADRYTYLSQIGLYIALVWGATQLGASWPARRWVFGIGSALLLGALMAGSWRQTNFWQDDKTLWEHALACDPKNVTAHCHLGNFLCQTDDDDAAEQYRAALELGPNERNIYNEIRAKAHKCLGDIAERKGDTANAIAHYKQALESDSNFMPACLNLGAVLAKHGDFDAATTYFQRSIDLRPDDAIGYSNMAAMQIRQGRIEAAIVNYRKSIKVNPDSGIEHMQLANLISQRGEVDDAIVHFRRAIELDPDLAQPYYQLAQLLRQQGKTNEAAKFQEQGQKASLRYAEAQNKRGTELAQQGKVAEAIAQFEIAIAVYPDYVQAHNNLADGLALQGNVDGAIAHYRRALEIDPKFAPAERGLQRLLHR